MQKVILFPLQREQLGTNLQCLISQWRRRLSGALTFALEFLQAMMTAPPEQERIEECRARHIRITGQF